ncbi:predicted protein [Histoplasma mississippiense (nom. inval.)]|uniref:predicted protein n=1 Tax=Ajellomyces capsulatus (strain NAm1 / WU24) TaxID=2059318 RepID=UPI000157C4E7|nr:predicted protein [Histoplasma mississippiense (nom. inval.)]EDN08238.1 predicted protein [Histoplasma mississippiense (nom. inval.)]
MPISTATVTASSNPSLLISSGTETHTVSPECGFKHIPHVSLGAISGKLIEETPLLILHNTKEALVHSEDTYTKGLCLSVVKIDRPCYVNLSIFLRASFCTNLFRVLLAVFVQDAGNRVAP